MGDVCDGMHFVLCEWPSLKIHFFFYEGKACLSFSFVCLRWKIICTQEKKGLEKALIKGLEKWTSCQIVEWIEKTESFS